MSDIAADDDEKTLIPVPVFKSRPRLVPRFMVVDDVFLAQTDEGEFAIPLKIPTKTVTLMEDLSPREQMHVLLSSRSADGDLERLQELDIIDHRELVRKFFQAFGEKEDARLGESFSSSTS